MFLEQHLRGIADPFWSPDSARQRKTLGQTAYARMGSGCHGATSFRRWQCVGDHSGSWEGGMDWRHSETFERVLRPKATHQKHFFEYTQNLWALSSSLWKNRLQVQALLTDLLERSWKPTTVYPSCKRFDKQHRCLTKTKTAPEETLLISGGTACCDRWRKSGPSGTLAFLFCGQEEGEWSTPLSLDRAYPQGWAARLDLLPSLPTFLFQGSGGRIFEGD